MNLTELCLQFITHNFEYFFSLYLKDDECLRKCFKFLQKRYTVYIFAELRDFGRLKDEYSSFLLNDFITSLNSKWLGRLTDNVFDKVAQIGKNIRTLQIDTFSALKDNEEEFWVNVIKHFPNLTNFTFFYFCTDEILKRIAKYCKNITEINIQNGVFITDAGLKYLCVEENGKPCSTLKKLSINSKHIIINSVKFIIKNLPSLQDIDYVQLPEILHSLHTENLATKNAIQIYQITNLNLNFQDLTLNSYDILKSCIVLCPNIKNMNCFYIKQEHLELISQLNNLEKITITPESEINLTDFLTLKGRKICSLTVRNNTVSITDLSSTCPFLKELVVTKVTVNDANALYAFPCLETLTFEGLKKLDSAALKAISFLLCSSPKLVSLSFISCILEQPELPLYILRCCENNPIRNIDLTISVCHEDFVKKILMNCHSLQHLNLTHCVSKLNVMNELKKCANELPNKPKLNFIEKLVMDYDPHDIGNVSDNEADYDMYDDYLAYD